VSRAHDALPRAGRHRGRRIAAWVTMTLAASLVLLALLVPDQLGRIAPAGLVSVPLEALLGVALLLSLPIRATPVAATLFGIALGFLAIIKLLNMGFFALLGRPFHPMLDWMLLDDGMRFLAGAIGSVPAIASLATAVVLSTTLIILMTRSVQHLARLVVRHNRAAARALVVLAIVWLTCALLGIQIVPGVPVAAEGAATYLQHRRGPVGTALQDQQEIAAAASADPFGDTPGEDLLTALRGKDVIIAFVESYGRDAVEDPEFAPQVGAVLEAGDHRLSAAGFTSRSAFLTSPTAGGSSWLAHATLLSGLWIDNQQRYDILPSSHRMTLTGAFRRANWRTVGVMPGNDTAWPESGSLGYDRIYDANEMGYKGPRFSWATMPDQYTLARFQRTEHTAQDRRPVMAEITLVSSHAPWEPIPRLVDWKDIGDGSVFNTMPVANDPPEAILTRNPGRVRTDYRASIEYSLSSLISYVETYGDDNLVLIFLGDHQPSPIVTGQGASRDVPITIISRDASVFDRISQWGWQEGLKPDAQAPVWRMDAFRDRFLSAFGRQTKPTNDSQRARIRVR
jgi:hypothetical protein